MDRTTMVLTIDLPRELGIRLNRAARRQAGRNLRDMTLEALEMWLEQEERGVGVGLQLEEPVSA